MNLLPGEQSLVAIDASHRKGPGRLYLTNQRVAWCAAGSAIPSVTLPLPDIRANMTSKAGAGPPMLKLTNQGDPNDAKVPGYRFEFADTRVGKADRDNFHEKLANMMKKITPRPMDTMPTTSTGGTTSSQISSTHTASAVVETKENERDTLLDADADLKLVYAQLVETGTITDQEFWEGRRNLLKVQGKLPPEVSQAHSLASELVTDLRPTQSTTNKVSFTLTPQIINQIFVELPVVRKAYMNNVPHRMSEGEFWTKYVQSQYFHSGKKGQILPSDDIFQQAASSLPADGQTGADKMSDEMQNNKRRRAMLDPAIDLAADDMMVEEDGPSTSTQQQQPQTKGKQREDVGGIARKMNRHGAVVVSSGLTVPAPPFKRLKEETRWEDLEEPVNRTAALLPQIDTAKYFGGHLASLAIPVDEQAQRKSRFVSEMTVFAPHDITFPDEVKAMKTLSLGTSKATDSQASATPSLPAVLQAIRQHLVPCQELLRHFWANLPPANPTLADKLQRIVNNLRTHQQELQLFVSGGSGGESGSHVGTQLLSMVNRALDKHDEFLKRPRK